MSVFWHRIHHTANTSVTSPYKETVSLPISTDVPVAVWIEAFGVESSDSDENGLRGSIGAADDSGAGWALGFYEEDNATLSNTGGRGKSSGECVLFLHDSASGTAGNVRDYVKVTAWNTGSVEIQWNGGSAAPSAAYRLRIDVFGGPQCMAAAGTFGWTTAATVDTGVDEDLPDAFTDTPEALLTAALHTQINDTHDPELRLTFGRATNYSGTIEQWSRGWASKDNNLGASLASRFTSNRAYSHSNADSGTALTQVEITAFKTGGTPTHGQFTWTPRAQTEANLDFGYLALSSGGLNGMRAKHWAAPVQTTGTKNWTGFAFRPQAFNGHASNLNSGVLDATADNTTSLAAPLGCNFGASADSHEGGQRHYTTSGASPTTVVRHWDTGELFEVQTHNGGASHRGTLTGMTADGFDIVVAAESIANAKLWGLFGIEADRFFDVAITAPATVGVGVSATARFGVAITGTAAVGVGLSATARVSSAIAGLATVSAGFQAMARFASAIAAPATVSAGLRATARTSSAIAGLATVSVGVSATARVSGAIAGLGTVSVGLSASWRISSAIAGTATVSAGPRATARTSSAIAGLATVSVVVFDKNTPLEVFPSPGVFELVAPPPLISGPPKEIILRDAWLRRTAESDVQVGKTQDADAWIRRTVEGDVER